MDEIVKVTGSNPAQLETTVRALLLEKSSKGISDTFLPDEIFDRFSELKDVEMSYASKMDEDLLLDPVDNDNPLMIWCECGPIFLKVSKMAFRNGFNHTCRQCGKIHKISLDSGVRIYKFEFEGWMKY